MAMPQEEAERWMGQALRMAEQGLSKGEFPIGAVVVLDDRVIASAHTLERSEGRFLVHADFLALDAADRIRPFPGDRRAAKLFVTMEPCLMCLGAAMSFFIGEVYYGVESPADGAVSLVRGWQRRQEGMPGYQVPEIVGGVLREEAIALFKEYVKLYTSGPMWEWARTIAAL